MLFSLGMTFTVVFVVTFSVVLALGGFFLTTF